MGRRSEVLVRDYIGALANSFTILELEKLFNECKVWMYRIRTGEYISEKSISLEFPRETEFVAVLTKF